MLGSLIAAIIGGIAGYFAHKEWGLTWGIICAISALFAAWLVIGLILRRLIGTRQQKIQEIMQSAQLKVNRQMEIFQRRPPSSMNAARQIVEKIQQDAVRKALAEMDGFRPYYKWNPMLSRQIATMKMQLYYQLKEYKKVDELSHKALMLDPQSLAIKLARMYKLEDAEIDKFYNKKCRRMKGENGAFLASVYAWIKLRQDNPKTALDALLNAKKSSDNAALLENIDRLQNNKIKHYSNSGFGDMWYALALEEPKIKPQRQTINGRGF